MKHQTSGFFRMRMTAAIAAVVIAAGSTTGSMAFRSHADVQESSGEKTASERSVSAGGTITAGQLSDELGLESTAASLTIEAVLVESGDTVTAGTALYQITADSLSKAEKTLRSELQSAENALLQQKLDYQADKNQAYALYQSELLLGDTAQQDYELGLTELDRSLQKAYDSYTEAQDTIDQTPDEITEKKNEMTRQQNTADSLQEEKTALQEELDQAKTEYSSAAQSYNSVVSNYNASAAVVRYLGKALGKDISEISLAQTVSVSLQKESSAAEEAAPAAEENDASFSGSFDAGSFDAGSFDAGNFSGSADFSGSGMKPDNAQASPQEKPDTSSAGQMPSQSTDTASVQVFAAQEQNTDAAPGQQNSVSSSDVTTLYETALSEYQSLKEKLTEAETAFTTAESAYTALAESMTELNTSLKEAQSNVTSLNKEISSLNTALSKAKSNISKLRSEYNSLKASYQSDQLALKNTLNTDTASYQNAAYHYQITCSTLDEELSEAQEAYDTAAENLRIFEAELADGYIRAKQDGQVYALNYKEGRNANLNTAPVTYVDNSSFTATVELDQNDVTSISIGDSVLLYASETGITNGRITAISAGTSTSLADVRFNVTVTADENTSLYYGQSVNVYFNSGSMTNFTDYQTEGSKQERPDFGGERPDFSGGMPEGFDPADLPDFGGGKDEK